MADDQKSLETAFRALEERLTHDREEVLKLFRSSKATLIERGKYDETKIDRETLDYFARVGLPITTPRGNDDGIFLEFEEHGGKRSINPRTDYAQRVCIPLGGGYVAKSPLPCPETIMRNWYIFNSDIISSCTGRDGRVISVDEETYAVLHQNGFSVANGFLMPKPVEVGVGLDSSGKLNVKPRGYGWIIQEDMSCGGEYEVTDILPHHFVTLENRADFFASYRRHLEALLAFSDTCEISVRRHPSSLNDYTLALSKMLLARVKENRGEIFIGDFNNLVFDEKKS